MMQQNPLIRPDFPVRRCQIDTHTDDVSASWEHLLNTHYRQWQLKHRLDTGFQAEIHSCDLDGIRLVHCVCDPCSGSRQQPQIRQDHEAFLVVQIVRSGEEHFRFNDEQIKMGPQDMVMWLSDQPAEFEVTHRLDKVSVIIPMRDVQHQLPMLRQPQGTVFSGRSGSHAVLYHHINALAQNMLLLTGEETQPLRRATLELISAALLPQVEERMTMSARYLHTIQEYILRHLSDPDLNPGLIARNHHISTRYLHHLFAQEGETVSVWIKRKRLQRCAQVLSQSLYHKQSVAEVAYQHGFNDPSHFGREFKRMFGCSPAEYRARYVAKSHLELIDE